MVPWPKGQTPEAITPRPSTLPYCDPVNVDDSA